MPSLLAKHLDRLNWSATGDEQGVRFGETWRGSKPRGRRTVEMGRSLVCQFSVHSATPGTTLRVALEHASVMFHWSSMEVVTRAMASGLMGWGVPTELCDSWKIGGFCPSVIHCLIQSSGFIIWRRYVCQGCLWLLYPAGNNLISTTLLDLTTRKTHQLLSDPPN